MHLKYLSSILIYPHSSAWKASLLAQLKRIVVAIAFLLIIFCNSNLQSQSTQDSLKQILQRTTDKVERVALLRELNSSYQKVNLDSALSYALWAHQEALTVNVDTILKESILDLASAYYDNNLVDSMIWLLKESIPYFEETGEYKTYAASFRNIARGFEVKQEPDSILYYLTKCEEILESYPDSSILGDLYMSRGMAYNIKGYYELSTKWLLESLRVFEAMDNPTRVGLGLLNLSMSYERMNERLKSQESLIRAKAIFEEADYQYAMAHVMGNLGVIYGNLEKHEEAKAAYFKAIELAQMTKQTFVEMNAYYNLAILYLDDQNKPDSCLYAMKKAEDLAIELDDYYILGEAETYSAFVALKKGNKSEARKHVIQAEKFMAEFPSLNDQSAFTQDISEIYEALGETEKAFLYFKQSTAIEDSLFTIERDVKASELQLIYETEKKDAAIALLNKQTELDATRKRALGGGIGLLALLAGGVIYGQTQRRKRIEERAHNEKAREIEKRRLVEQELEFKQKELTAKVLQLASKNEFLQSLEQEVSDLKSSVDSTVSKTTQRISRMINSDASDDREWEQFGKEFSSIHQDFLDRLKAQYGSFSKSEMRLIALLKMNLSSKDIANTLRISDDGVKKARYRLRKKMSIDSSLDIQEFILNY